MRKILAALLCAALLFPIIVTPVAAIGEGNCENIQTVNSWVGDRLDPTTFTNVRGIRSQIFDQQDLDMCQPGGTDITRGPAAWVALQPSFDNPQYGNVNAILQIGVINCEAPFLEECDGSAPQYFWADGGCNGDLPQPVGLGPAPTGGITFAVRHIGNSTYYLSAVPANGGPTVSVTTTNNSNIGCWALGGGDSRRVAGTVFCERWDNGDNCGGGGAGSVSNVNFEVIRFQVSVDGQWYIPGNAGSPLGQVTCSTPTAELHCVDTGPDDFGTWAAQQ